MPPRILELPSSAGPSAVRGGSIRFIGTATTLISLGPFTILTDPNFLHRGQAAKLGYGLRSKRRTNPALEIAELPPLDLCILSHLHGDHWDEEAERGLRKDLPVVTTAEGAAGLHAQGFREAMALPTWETVTVRKGEGLLRITSMPGKHAPGPLEAAIPKVMGTMLELATSAGDTVHRMYITGDTLVFDGLREIRRRYPDIDLALLHLGGTRIFGLLLTMDARQGVRALRIVRPKLAIPIHYNDYGVFKSPLSDFQQRVEAAGLAGKVHTLRHGESYQFETEG